MFPHGSLAESPLRALLETAQSERSTGTLTLRNGNGQATSLYFLFGHLFHAQGDGKAGDDAVVAALRWTKGDFDFDPKAKLPADETVKAGIGELVQAAETAPKPPPPAPAPPPTPEPMYAMPVQLPTIVPQPRVEPAAAHTNAHSADRQVEPPSPRRGVKHRPQPKHGREPIPVPAGQVFYDSLKTSFVDFPRLITTLEKDGFTGYVRLLTDDAAGLILFRDGSALECLYDGAAEAASLVLGKPALQLFNEDVTNGHGVLDVVGLSEELIDGLYQLTVSRPMYAELYAAWVDTRALLRFLSDRRLSGSVMIRAAKGTGVIILADGELAGAYTSESRDISDKPDRALALCEDANAVIEVKSAESVKHPPLDVDEVVTGQRSVRTTQAIPTAAASLRAPAEGVGSAGMPTPPPVHHADPGPMAPAPPAPAYATYPPPNFTPAAYPTTYPQPGYAPQQPPPPMPAPAPAPAMQPPQAPMPMAAPAPTQVAPTSPPRPAAPAAPAGPQLDWSAIVAELQAMADDALGNRARKVKDILGAADPSLTGIENAIDQIPGISLLFVDSSRLEQLSQEMKARLKSHL